MNRMVTKIIPSLLIFLPAVRSRHVGHLAASSAATVRSPCGLVLAKSVASDQYRDIEVLTGCCSDTTASSLRPPAPRGQAVRLSSTIAPSNADSLRLPPARCQDLRLRGTCPLGVESRLHWVVDVVFRDRLARLRTGHGPENKAIVRHAALNLVSQAKPTTGMEYRGIRAGWNTNHLASIPGQTA